VETPKQRDQRASLIALLEQATGARAIVEVVDETDTIVVLEGGRSQLTSLRAKADPNRTLWLALDLVEAELRSP
jgi:hypothetical protein